MCFHSSSGFAPVYSPIQVKTAIVLGASGSVGARVVHYLLKDPRIRRVTAVVRRNQNDTAQWLSDGDEDKAKLAQMEVDFEKLDDNSPGWNGHDLGFTCIGLYTGAKPEDEWKHIEIDYNVQAAKLLKAGGTERFHYLSGQGVVEGGASSFLFSRVKGTAEAALRMIGFSNFATFRPGAIYGRPVERKMYVFEPIMNAISCWIGSVGGSTCDDIAKAMVLASLMDNPPTVVENAEIKQMSKQFENSDF